MTKHVAYLNQILGIKLILKGSAYRLKYNAFTEKYLIEDKKIW